MSLRPSHLIIQHGEVCSSSPGIVVFNVVSLCDVLSISLHLIFSRLWSWSFAERREMIQMATIRMSMVKKTTGGPVPKKMMMSQFQRRRRLRHA